MTDAELAAHVAAEAGRLALDLRASGGLEGRALGDEGDRAANVLIVEALRRARPDDGLLSEESRDDGTRLGHDRVWIVDPIDGTREFGEGRSDWAVHVGLAIGGEARVGAVALPDLDQVLRTDNPLILGPLPAHPRIVVSRSRAPRIARPLADAMGGAVVPMGSAGAKAMAVVRGEAEIYLHDGGQHEWDSCAPVAVALAHGLHCSRLDGSPLVYNRRDPYLPDLLVCRAELADEVLERIAGLGR
ncbi:3'(2'),5'-bisphosphate nucleotidase CysQ [Qipengyuania sp. MTN3-11]|uniref:3'(2'),5'-bisphosphate nucleotidase CysQ n=1 Tax=Qipengyuania sp. MTN3-11 TaxID=3056557 RepID=UPI0036F1CB7A